jgi:hypothetical protein
MLQFYKPTQKNTGSACSFMLAVDKQGVMLSFVKQKSWDSKSGKGKFYTSRRKDGNMVDGEENATTVKLNRSEVAGVIDSIESNRKLDAFHEFNGKESSIHFGPYRKSKKNPNTNKWEEHGDQVGFSLSVVKSKPVKGSFRIGLTFPEARLLKHELENFLTQTTKEFKISKPEAVEDLLA